MNSLHQKALCFNESPSKIETKVAVSQHTNDAKWHSIIRKAGRCDVKVLLKSCRNPISDKLNLHFLSNPVLKSASWHF